MPNGPKQIGAFAPLPERRRSVRYPITGDASFQWKALDGHWQEASGVTRDIAKNGAFVGCGAPPPVGSHLRLVVTLPTRSGSYGKVCLSGTGRVRHVQREDLQETGFGACMEFQLELPMSAGHHQ